MFAHEMIPTLNSLADGLERRDDGDPMTLRSRDACRDAARLLTQLVAERQEVSRRAAWSSAVGEVLALSIVLRDPPPRQDPEEALALAVRLREGAESLRDHLATGGQIELGQGAHVVEQALERLAVMRGANLAGAVAASRETAQAGRVAAEILRLIRASRPYQGAVERDRELRRLAGQHEPHCECRVCAGVTR